MAQAEDFDDGDDGTNEQEYGPDDGNDAEDDCSDGIGNAYEESWYESKEKADNDVAQQRCEEE